MSDVSARYGTCVYALMMETWDCMHIGSLLDLIGSAGALGWVSLLHMEETRGMGFCGVN